MTFFSSKRLYQSAGRLIAGALLLTLSLGANAQQSLPEVPEHLVNNTMYQAFYWDAYPGLWNDLPAMAQPLAEAGITSLWLPPAAKGMAGTFSVGYDVYDFWDLGEFDQKGTVPTRYGTRQQLENALAALDNLGIEAYYDVVFNHRMGADAQENIPNWGTAWSMFNLDGRDAHYTQDWGYLYHNFQWDWTAFNGIDDSLFPGKWWGNTFHFPYLMGNDVDYNRNDVVDEMKAWGEWIINHVGFNGFRMDAIAHVDSDFTRDWVNHVQWATNDEVFFVAEAWVNDVIGYLDHVGTPHLRAFDFQLREDFVSLSSGNKDMRWWGGLVNSHRAEQAVTFVDNHDTSRAGNPYGMPEVNSYKNQAYAYILMREQGVPTVFARDYDEFGMAPTLDKLIEARRYFAYGPGHEYSGNTEAVYAYVREGLAEVPGTGLVMLISGRNWGTQQSHWINSHQPDTTFYDYTGNVSGTVTTDANGFGSFPVNMSEGTGWSIWVPEASTGSQPGSITLRMTKDVGYGHSLYFTGSPSILTSWGGGVEGTWTVGNVWEVSIPDPGNFEWKTRRGPAGTAGVDWEGGGNHNQNNLHPTFNGGF
ncbi:alpha-amylase domain-containing protein [Marinimicrobium alkaliphilum]|uniref:alpha-amylase domain-containing protein n=1 Tax=Marinimicrobium alkaliphilum TaxID=2202654 RepID=UPI0018E0A1ED|nr:alpha-amylase domain-containing protein [Marinimicrobium alkaliphilum]